MAAHAAFYNDFYQAVKKLPSVKYDHVPGCNIVKFEDVQKRYPHISVTALDNVIQMTNCVTWGETTKQPNTEPQSWKIWHVYWYDMPYGKKAPPVTRPTFKFNQLVLDVHVTSSCKGKQTKKVFNRSIMQPLSVIGKTPTDDVCCIDVTEINSVMSSTVDESLIIDKVCYVNNKRLAANKQTSYVRFNELD